MNDSVTLDVRATAMCHMTDSGRADDQGAGTELLVGVLAGTEPFLGVLVVGAAGGLGALVTGTEPLVGVLVDGAEVLLGAVVTGTEPLVGVAAAAAEVVLGALVVVAGALLGAVVVGTEALVGVLSAGTAALLAVLSAATEPLVGVLISGTDSLVGVLAADSEPEVVVVVMMRGGNVAIVRTALARMVVLDDALSAPHEAPMSNKPMAIAPLLRFFITVLFLGRAEFRRPAGTVQRTRPGARDRGPEWMGSGDVTRGDAVETIDRPG